MATSDYRSHGNFAPLYTNAKRALYDNLYPDQARRAECVLNHLADHCNPFGTCYVKVYRLMDLTHYSEGTVKRALIALAELDYIRIHIEFSVARQENFITWQISPFVIWIVKDNIDMAEQLWNAAQNAVSLYRNEMFNGQPESEPESKPAPEPDSRTNHRTTTTTKNQRQPKTAKTDSEAPTQPTPGGPAALPAQSAKKPQGEARTPQRPAPNQPQNQVPPPASPVPPSAPPQRTIPDVPLETCKDPLEGWAEKVAQRVADLNTRLPQARQLVKQYDCQNVETGLKWLELEGKKGEIKKPFGLLKWWLEHNAILPGDEPHEQPEQDEQVSIAGKFSDFFER